LNISEFWADRLGKSSTPTIQGCIIFLIVIFFSFRYLDPVIVISSGIFLALLCINFLLVLVVVLVLLLLLVLVVGVILNTYSHFTFLFLLVVAVIVCFFIQAFPYIAQILKEVSHMGLTTAVADVAADTTTVEADAPPVHTTGDIGETLQPPVECQTTIEVIITGNSHSNNYRTILNHVFIFGVFFSYFEFGDIFSNKCEIKLWGLMHEIGLH
ncbi:hypothetical protein ACJX0J_029077, partial [Zea mays]